MPLSSLPIELKLHILSHADSLPTLHFALTCKDHFKIAQKRMALFKKYARVTPGDGEQENEDKGDGQGEVSVGHKQQERKDPSIWQTTLEILANPWKGTYVRELNIVAACPETNENLSEEQKASLKTAATEILARYAGTSDSDFWVTEEQNTETLEKVFQQSWALEEADMAVVILLHYCPEIHTFRMTAHGCGVLTLFLRRLASCYQDPEMVPSLPLQRLKIVAVAHYDTENSLSIDWAVYFMCVPSVRTFAAFMMGSEHVYGHGAGDEDEGERERDASSESYLRNTVGAVSNVEELVLTQSQFDPGSFNTLLPMIRGLKKFSYDSGGHCVANTDVQPRKVIRALASHAAHSLEELELVHWGGSVDDCEDDIAIAPIRALTKLKALSCEARWLLPLEEDERLDNEPLLGGFFSQAESEENVQDPRDMLPASLEYLCLDTKEMQWDVLCNLFNHRNERTPLLTLDNTRLTQGDRQFGRGAASKERFDSPLLEDIWRGHNTWL
ncbi:hypothetical protein G6514_009797 [Epicoccum nigrum]|nr:hypothetical protein G6514_009797 [Epicoccum nigrum]